MTVMWASTIRLPIDLARHLETIARVDEVPISHAIREAIEAHVAARRADPQFQQRLRARIDADQQLTEAPDA
jgi:predicted transcriptional regulator